MAGTGSHLSDLSAESPSGWWTTDRVAVAAVGRRSDVMQHAFTSECPPRVQDVRDLDGHRGDASSPDTHALVTSTHVALSRNPRFVTRYPRSVTRYPRSRDRLNTFRGTKILGTLRRSPDERALRASPPISWGGPCEIVTPNHVSRLSPPMCGTTMRIFGRRIRVRRQPGVSSGALVTSVVTHYPG
jgi:hypothetical protein